MSADISVHQIEHIYYCQKDESVTMNLKKLNHPKKPTTLHYTSMLMTTLPQITLASRSMRELSPCCPFSPFLSLATWKSGGFRGSKKAGAEWREATASALQQIPGLEILTGKSQRLDQSQHGDDISETTRNEWFFYHRKRGTLVHNKEVICCMSVVKLKRNWCIMN